MLAPAAACLWLLLLPSCSIAEFRLLTPPSFPVGIATTAVASNWQEAHAVESLIKVLSTYRVQSHIDVVLVGDTFTAAMVDGLTSSIRELSQLASKATPLKYTHEELIFHVALGSGIKEELQAVMKAGGRYIAPDKITPILSEYHAHMAMTTTTIFVYHSGTAGSYAYASSVPSCPQRAFLSKEGFALIDLSAKFISIRSVVDAVEHAVSTAEFPFLEKGKVADRTAMQASLHDLATLIHRSGEALVPFPVFASDTALLGGEPTMQSGTYTGTDCVILTICLYEGVCEDDKNTVDAVYKLANEFLFGQKSTMGVFTYEVSVDSDAAVAHALHAASSFATKQLSTKELLYWLGSSTTIRSILFKHGQHQESGDARIFKRRLVPVFVVKLPDGIDMALDDGKQAVSSNFPEPPGGWLDSFEGAFIPGKSIPINSDWPTSAVVTLRGRSGTPLPGVRSGLDCGGSELPKSAEDYTSDFLNEMLSALHGIVPPHLHYSSSSRRLVTDYMWAQPPAMRTLLVSPEHAGDGYSFREHRLVPRHALLHGADAVLASFASTLQDLGAIRPAVNVTSLLGLDHILNSAVETTGFTMTKTKTINKGERSRPAVASFPTATTTGDGSKGGLAAFLYHLDRMAESFAQMNFALAMASLASASMVLEELKKEVDGRIKGRTGVMFCKDMRPHSVTYRTADTMEYAGVNNNNDPEKNVLLERKRRGQFWLFMMAAVLVGGVVGWVQSRSSHAKKRGLD